MGIIKKTCSRLNCLCRLQNLWIYTLIIIIIVIAVIEISDYISHECVNGHSRIHSVILNISYSLLGCCVFFFLNDWIPTIHKRKVAECHVSRQLRDMHEELRIIVQNELFLYNLNDNIINNFVIEFENAQLQTSSLMNPNISKEESINKRRTSIINISNNLLSSYFSILSSEQLTFLDNVLKSEFANNRLKPMEWKEDNTPILNYPNNQKKIGESIYQIYLQSKKICSH